MRNLSSVKSIDFSIIIPAFNADKTLQNCLQALAVQTVPKEKYEIIVVDDGSTDATSIIALRFDVCYIFQNNRGPASARNAGAAAAAGRIILFTDADCTPCRNWLEKMVQPFEDERVVAAKGSYKTHQTELAARFAQMEFEDRYDLLKKSDCIDMIDTYSAAFRRDVFQNTGGFDVSFPKANNEDTELSYRLSKAGYRMVFVPAAVVYHTHPSSFLKYLKLKFWRGYWRIIVYRRYPDKAIKDSYTPNILKVQTVLMALTIPFCPLSFTHLLPLTPIILVWTVIGMTSLPFAIKTFKKDKIVGLLSPMLILLRSLSFALGSVLGLMKWLIQRQKFTNSI